MVDEVKHRNLFGPCFSAEHRLHIARLVNFYRFRSQMYPKLTG